MLKKKIASLFLLLLICWVPFMTHSSKIKIGIISDANYYGEREVAWRIKIAAERLGWKVFLDEKRGRKIKKIKHLDWVICTLPGNKYLHKNCPVYQTIFHPFSYLDSEGKLEPFYEKYDGYLLTIGTSEAFENGFKLKQKDLFTSTFYPTLQHIDYKKIELKNLVTLIPVWSNRLTDEKFKTIYKILSRTLEAKFYGVPENSHLVEKGYMGRLPFNGTSVIQALQESGIVLIFHSDIHNEVKIPSPRIFEAAAASTVIISDKNQFVQKHFGDAVLYVDTSLSPEEICTQIQNHLDWIHQNPEVALEMAKKSHQIFADQFSMDHQLLDVLAMHEKVKQKKSRPPLNFWRR